MWYVGLWLHHRHEFFMFQKSYPIPHRHDVERIVTLSLFWELLFHIFLSFKLYPSCPVKSICCSSVDTTTWFCDRVFVEAVIVQLSNSDEVHDLSSSLIWMDVNISHFQYSGSYPFLIFCFTLGIWSVVVVVSESELCRCRGPFGWSGAVWFITLSWSRTPSSTFHCPKCHVVYIWFTWMNSWIISSTISIPATIGWWSSLAWSAWSSNSLRVWSPTSTSFRV